MKSGGPRARPPPCARRPPRTPATGDGCAVQTPCGWLQGSGVTAVCSGPWGLSSDSAAAVDGLRGRCHARGMSATSTLVSRRHVDLGRVASAACSRALRCDQLR
ncbi:putative leader peptide [Streptomyces sp. NPDC005506]|uniref:putative leader peptide n=1 Tax=Streptomyces sp. NPDC005506 TaxID=3364718 RepID=UPI0036A967D8